MRTGSIRALVCICGVWAFSLLLAASAFGFTDIDPNFSPAVSKPLSATPGRTLLVQPDGKLIVVGGWNVVDGKAKGEIFRLNTDGSRDDSFSFCSCGFASLTNALLQPDGRILVAGSAAGTSQMKLVRLMPDGSIDPSFNVVDNVTGLFSSKYTLIGVDPDGKVLALRYYSYSIGVGYSVARFLPDGSKDPSFTEIFFGASRTLQVSISGYERLSDGRFYLGDNSGLVSSGSVAPHLKRYNADGTLDSTYSPPAISWTQFSTSALNSIGLQSDGGLILGGDFASVNGVAKPDLARVLAAGNVDTAFNSIAVTSVAQLKIVAGDKILAVVTDGAFTGLRRYLADGTPDKSFAMAAEVGSVVSNFTIDAVGRIYVIGNSGGGSQVYRLTSDGALDATYSPNAADSATVKVTAVASDGDVYIAGDFDRVNGVATGPLARLNADGTLDAGFSAGSGFSSTPKKLIVQPDGKLLAIGTFSSYNGTPRAAIARLLTNGTLDASFAPTATGLKDIQLDATGRILIGGSFSSVNATPRVLIARLNSDGTLDTGFTPNITSGSSVTSIVVEPSGSILAGGTFIGADGFNRPNLIRLTSAGALDASFNAGSISAIDAIRRQSTGKIVYLYSSNRSLKRVLADGTADPSFSVTVASDNGSEDINDLVISSDDSMVIGGDFDRVNSTLEANIARLGPDGQLDPNFLASGTDDVILDLALRADGGIIAAGAFHVIDAQIRSGIARILVVPFARKTSFDFDGDGRADEVVFRPSENYWYLFKSADSTVAAVQFGAAGDLAVPADFDGDNITDIAVFRPSTGDWWWRRSIDGVTNGTHWGQAGDIPLPADWDANGTIDQVVYRPSNFTWYKITPGPLPVQYQFGAAGDQPLVADLDGDGKFDPTIFRPSTGDWWWRSSVDGVQKAIHWGQAGDIPVPADYDGDGKTDAAVFRPSNGGWYVLNSHDLSFYIIGFGLTGDKPVSADFDGDGKADIAVFRPSDGVWYLWRTTAGFGALQFGASNDVPAENAFVP